MKSVNVAKRANSLSTTEAHEVKNTGASIDASVSDLADGSYITEKIGNSINGVGELDQSEPPVTQKELEGISHTGEDKNGYDNKTGISEPMGPNDVNSSGMVGDSLSHEMIDGNLMKDEMCKPPSNDENTSRIELESNENIASSISASNIDREEEELKSEEDNAKSMGLEKELRSQEYTAEIATSVELDEDDIKELDATEDGDKETEHGDVFEPGSVFVEYRRTEAACVAAHCLNGRIFDGRVVTVGYVDHDLYLTEFRR